MNCKDCGKKISKGVVCYECSTTNNMTKNKVKVRAKIRECKQCGEIIQNGVLCEECSEY